MPATLMALAAVRAIKQGRRWGAFATHRFLENRGALRHYGSALRFEIRRRSRPWTHPST